MVTFTVLRFSSLLTIDFDAALEAFLNRILETWASSEHIKHSLLSRHKCKDIICDVPAVFNLLSQIQHLSFC